MILFLISVFVYLFHAFDVLFQTFEKKKYILNFTFIFIHSYFSLILLFFTALILAEYHRVEGKKIKIHFFFIIICSTSDNSPKIIDIYKIYIFFVNFSSFFSSFLVKFIYFFVGSFPVIEQAIYKVVNVDLPCGS